MGIRNKLILSSVVPLLFLLILSSYFFITSYLKFEQSRALSYTLDTNTKLSKFLKHLQKERDLTSLYIESHKPTYVELLKKQYSDTDKAIGEMQTLLPQPKVYLSFFETSFKESDKQANYNYIALIKNLERLNEVRSSVATKKESFLTHFFQNYTYNQTSKFIYHMQRVKNYTLSEEMAYLTYLLSTLYSVQEYSSLERGYVSYFLHNQKSMKESEYAKWHTLHTLANTLNFQEIRQSRLRKKFQELMDLQKSSKLLEETVKHTIQLQPKARDSMNSKETLTWFSQQTKKLSLLTKIELIVSDILFKKNEAFKQKQITIFLLSLFTLLLSLFLTYLWHSTTREITRNIKVLERVLNSAMGNVKKSHKALIEPIDAIQHINLDTYEGQNRAYTFLDTLVKTAKQDKQEALEASEAKSLFLANMSHEIRTPLNGIVGFTEILKNTTLNKEQREFIHIIEKSSEGLLHTINNILDLSKAERNQATLESIVFSPYEIFENSVETYAVNASEKKTALNFYMDPTIPNKLKGDPTKLKEVLNNLLSNAVKFTQDGGEINIQIQNITKSDEETIRLIFSIQDTGIGIGKEQQEKIFNAFTQEDTTITREFGGTGLGLAISKRFVALMGGTLEVESTKTYGSTFFFTLPFEKALFDKPTELQAEPKTIAIYRPERQGKFDTYLQNYLAYFGVTTFGFDTIEGVQRLLHERDIEQIWIEYEKIDESLLKVLCRRPTNHQVVLMCQITNRKKAETLGLKHQQMILKPVTLSKVSATLFETFTLEVKDLEVTYEQHFDAKALVVEDNEINQKLVATMLKTHGLEVTTACNGLEAFEKIRIDDYDIILMDIQMPILGGVEVTQEIHAYETYMQKEHTPIIALTANTLKGDREKYLSLGLDGYLAKPLEKHTLLQLLYTFLGEKVVKSKEDKQKTQQTLVPSTETGKETVPTKKVLLAKRFALESRVLSRILDNLDIDYDILEGLENLEEALESNTYDILFTDPTILDTHPKVTVITKANSKEEITTLLKLYRG
jgi:signal transduction histidine kinase/DNA-binding response OmpR family regulator